MKVFFYAKVGDLNQKPYGGGEVGNRRTLEMLRELGYNVKLVPRYYNYDEKSLFVYVKIIVGDVFSLLRLFFCLITRGRKRAIVHVSGYTGKYLPIELFSILVSKVLLCKVIYEIRGGGIVEEYEDRGYMYKLMFKSAVSIPNVVFSQGMENEQLITSFCGSNAFFYYPNCIAENDMAKSCPLKSCSPIKCLYIGRLAPFKNVDLVLKIIKKVYDGGYDVKIDIIGDGIDFPSYVRDIKAFVENNMMEPYCCFKGYLNKDEMKNYLKEACFFIFPSNESREGQSNALTEAMAYGVIPLVSNKGFSAGTVDCDELVFKTYKPEDYAKKMMEIIQEQRIEELSNKMYTRIQNNFLYSQIREKVKKEYEKIYTY